MPPGPGDRLDSWKEIAAYARRGVRTVRRWEREEGLPVHRHLHRKLGSVYAFKSEIDAWRQSDARAGKPRPPARPGAEPGEREVRSIAVLPFANLSAEPENEYFAAGLTDEVTADLAKVGALRVTSRTSAMVFRRANRPAREVADRLGVRYLLEGSVRRAGGRLRVTAQLIDAHADDHLWAESYDGTLEDVFAIQERLARLIVDALELRLTADERRRLQERPIEDVRAWACYLQARQLLLRWREDAIDLAVQLLRNGLALIGDNARLYATLGLAHLQYREAGIDYGEAPLREAEACARRVVALDPASTAGLRLRGWIHYSRGRIQDAVRDLEAAHRAEPSDADTLLLLSNCYLISGRVTPARPLLERLLAVDPLTPLCHCMPAYADLLEGDLAAAVEPYRRMLEMDPANPMARLFYLWVLVVNAKGDEAAEVVAAWPTETLRTVPGQIASFLVRAFQGDREGALSVVTPEAESAGAATDVFARFLAQGFALAGMPDPALRWLEVAVERGFVNHPFLAVHDPCLRSLRDDPRFVRLMERVRERCDAFEA